MTELLDEVDLALSDLLQSGLSTGGPAAVPRLQTLAARCEDTGLHTGAALLTEIETGLTARTHTMEKNDLPLTAVICRAAGYVQLCREKLQEERILQRWQGGVWSDDTNKEVPE